MKPRELVPLGTGLIFLLQLWELKSIVVLVAQTSLALIIIEGPVLQGLFTNDQAGCSIVGLGLSILQLLVLWAGQILSSVHFFGLTVVK